MGSVNASMQDGLKSFDFYKHYNKTTSQENSRVALPKAINDYALAEMRQSGI